MSFLTSNNRWVWKAVIISLCCIVFHDAVDAIGLLSFSDQIKTIYSLDDQKCIPRLICELASTHNQEVLTPQEKTVLRLFGSSMDSQPGSPQTLYREAASIGSESQNSEVCETKYSTCPLRKEQLVSIFNLISATAEKQQESIKEEMLSNSRKR